MLGTLYTCFPSSRVWQVLAKLASPRTQEEEELDASHDADPVLAFEAVRISSLLSSLAFTTLLSFDSCWST